MGIKGQRKATLPISTGCGITRCRRVNAPLLWYESHRSGSGTGVSPLCQKHSYEELCFHHPRSQPGANQMVTGLGAVFMGVLGHFFSGLEPGWGWVPLDKQGRSRARCPRGAGLTGDECLWLFTGTVCDDLLHMWRLIVPSTNRTDWWAVWVWHPAKHLGRCLMFLSRIFTSLSTKNEL